MKTIIQAIITSLVIHLLYFIGMTIVGFIQTNNYQPDIAGAWNDVEVLQSEVAIGYFYSPLYLFGTFIGITLLCTVIIYLYKKIMNERKRG